MAHKTELRSLYLAKRKDLSTTEYLQNNLILYKKFFTNIDLSSIKVIHSFLPIIGKKEPDTLLILERIKKEYPQIRISVPRVNIKNHTLQHIYFEEINQLKENKWGIREPQKGISTKTEDIDLVITPLLVFDAKGNRIGYGKGYYDLFLSSCRSDCFKIGLSFFPPVKTIPIEHHDIPLNGCITPEKTYFFKPKPTDQ